MSHETNSDLAAVAEREMSIQERTATTLAECLSGDPAFLKLLSNELSKKLAGSSQFIADLAENISDQMDTDELAAEVAENINTEGKSVV